MTTVGAMFGASLANYFSKGRLQQFVQGKLADDGMVMQLSKALGSDGGLEPRETILLIFLSRVPPLFPFALINYAYALTDMRFRMFFIPSFLGVWPCCTLDAYMGTLFEKLADVLTVSPAPILSTAPAECDGSPRGRKARATVAAATNPPVWMPHR